MRWLVFCAATVLASAPAAAATWDAFASFTGTAIGGAFSYGRWNGSGFTPFDETPGCAALIAGTTCTSDGGLPAVFKTAAGAHKAGSITVPGDALIAEPGTDSNAGVAIAFVAPRTGDYLFHPTSFAADSNPSPVTIGFFYPLPNGATGFYSARVDQFGKGGFLIQDNLDAGQSLGITFAGDGGHTASAADLLVTAIPEPASWAMMVVGFGLVGALRRKRGATRAA